MVAVVLMYPSVRKIVKPGNKSGESEVRTAGGGPGAGGAVRTLLSQARLNLTCSMNFQAKAGCGRSGFPSSTCVGGAI